MGFDFPLGYIDQQTFMNALDADLAELETITQGFILETSTEPTQAEWEDAWETAGYTLPIPPGQELIWFDGTRPRGIYMVVNNDLMSILTLWRVFPAKNEVIVDGLNLMEYIRFVDDRRMAVVGRAPDAAREFPTIDTLYWYYPDGSLKIMASPSFEVGVNASKLTAGGGVVYADDDYIWLAANGSIPVITLTANLPTARYIRATSKVATTSVAPAINCVAYWKTINTGAINWDSITLEILDQSLTIRASTTFAVAASEGLVEHSFNFNPSAGANITTFYFRFQINGSPVSGNAGLAIFDPFLFTDDGVNNYDWFIAEDFRAMGTRTITGMTVALTNAARLARYDRNTQAQEMAISVGATSALWESFNPDDEIVYGLSGTDIYQMDWATGTVALTYAGGGAKVSLRYYNGRIYWKNPTLSSHNIVSVDTAGAGQTTLVPSRNTRPFLISKSGKVYDYDSGILYDIPGAAQSVMPYADNYFQRLRKEFEQLTVPQGRERVYYRSNRSDVPVAWYAHLVENLDYYYPQDINEAEDSIILASENVHTYLDLGAGYALAGKNTTGKIWRLQLYADHVPDWKLVAKTSVGSARPSVTWDLTSLLGDDIDEYDHLMIHMNVTRDVAGDGVVLIQFNGNTSAAAYISQYIFGHGTTEGAAEQYHNFSGIVMNANVHTRIPQTLVMIPDFNNPDTYKQAQFINGFGTSYVAGALWISHGIGIFQNAGKITSIKIVPTANNLAANDEFRLFALRGKRRTYRDRPYEYSMA